MKETCFLWHFVIYKFIYLKGIRQKKGHYITWLKLRSRRRVSSGLKLVLSVFVSIHKYIVYKTFHFIIFHHNIKTTTTCLQWWWFELFDVYVCFFAKGNICSWLSQENCFTIWYASIIQSFFVKFNNNAFLNFCHIEFKQMTLEIRMELFLFFILIMKLKLNHIKKANKLTFILLTLQVITVVCCLLVKNVLFDFLWLSCFMCRLKKLNILGRFGKIGAITQSFHLVSGKVLYCRILDILHCMRLCISVTVRRKISSKF